MAKVASRGPNEALMELQAQDAERSGEGYDPEPPFTEEPPPPAPEPFRPEPPDWREEERIRAERDAKPAPVELESRKSLQPRPAPKRRKSKTPLIDQVKAWRKDNP